MATKTKTSQSLRCVINSAVASQKQRGNPQTGLFYNAKQDGLRLKHHEGTSWRMKCCPGVPTGGCTCSCYTGEGQDGQRQITAHSLDDICLLVSHPFAVQPFAGVADKL